MRELSGEQHTEREGFPDVSAGPEPARNKGWLWHSFAALVVAALGLVVAAAVGLTTDAQTTRDLSAVPDTSVAVSSAPIDGAPIQTGRVPGTNKQSKSQHPALAAFGRRETATTSRSSRSGAIRAAIVQEQAAQRGEREDPGLAPDRHPEDGEPVPQCAPAPVRQGVRDGGAHGPQPRVWP